MAEDLHYLILATDLHWGANQRWLQDYPDSVDMHCSYFDYILLFRHCYNIVGG